MVFRYWEDVSGQTRMLSYKLNHILDFLRLLEKFVFELGQKHETT